PARRKASRTSRIWAASSEASSCSTIGAVRPPAGDSSIVGQWLTRRAAWIAARAAAVLVPCFIYNRFFENVTVAGSGASDARLLVEVFARQICVGEANASSARRLHQ